MNRKKPAKKSNGHMKEETAQVAPAPLDQPHIFVQKYVTGRELKEVERFLTQWGYEYRVVEEDAKQYIVTKDFHPKRFNLKVKNGKVIEYHLG